MIEAKGTKTGGVQPDPAEKYATKDDERKSVIPFAVGALLAGLAVYLKSIFPSWAKEDGDPVREQVDEADMRGEPQLSLVEPPYSTDAVERTPQASARDRFDFGNESFGAQDRAYDIPLVESSFYGDFLLPEIPLSWENAQVPMRPVPANDNTVAPAGRMASGGGGDVEDGDDLPEDDGGGDETASDDGNPENEDTDSIDTDEQDQDTDDGEAEDDESENPGDDDDGDDDGKDVCVVNRAPRVSAPVCLADISVCAVLTIALNDLLQHAHDPDGDSLSIVNLTTSSGSLSRDEEGWLFTPDPQSSGPVTISYQITDGKLTVDQVAHLSVTSDRRHDRPKEDGPLSGDPSADHAVHADSVEMVHSRGAGDTITGSGGDDHIVAGPGNDVIIAGEGDDVVFAGAGNDLVFGGPGDDRLHGEAGDDILHGEDGNDFISGGDGDDTLYGGAGDDHLCGGDGNDTIFDGEGRDFVDGGAGDDHVIASLDGDDDIFEGGAGFDTLDYSAATEDLTLDLVNGRASGIEIGNDCITGFEALVGGQGNDHFIIGDDAVVLTGGAGNNIFEFRLPETKAVETSVVEKTIYEIMDFKVGDRIRMSKYDLFEKVVDELEDRFEELYGEDVDEDDVPIRYRHDQVGNKDRTVIEADFNRDDIYETAIWLDGHRLLVTLEHA